MTIEKVLRNLAEDNFDEPHYYPVAHGQNAMIKPLAIVVKKRRSIFKRPFAKSEFIVIAVLDDYVENEKKEEFNENVNSMILKEGSLEVGSEEDEEDKGSGASSFVSVKLEAARSAKVNVKIADDFGELELGKLDQEYFSDPVLRELLAKTVLNVNRMEGLESQKLRLIYSVIYSEKFELKGKRKHEIQVDAGVQAPEVVQALKYAQLKGMFKKKKIPQKAATRNTRGPVFFKFVRVDYDKENRRLKLSEGEFAGRSFQPAEKRDSEEKDKAEYEESVVGMENEDSDSPEPLTDDDINKLKIIKESVLMCEDQSREQRKQRVKKYLKWFEGALTKEEKKISSAEPLTDGDCEFLRKIFCPAQPNQTTVELPKSFDREKIQGYAIVFKQINDLTDEHWDEIEKAWTEQDK